MRKVLMSLIVFSLSFFSSSVSCLAPLFVITVPVLATVPVLVCVEPVSVIREPELLGTIFTPLLDSLPEDTGIVGVILVAAKTPVDIQMSMKVMRERRRVDKGVEKCDIVK